MQGKHYIFYLLFVFVSCRINAQTTIGLLQHDAGSLDSGYILFAPIPSTSTYLINKCGKLVKTWTSNYNPGQSCYLLSDGTLLRTGNVNNTTFNTGGKGGIIEKTAWNNNVIWSYTISDSTKCQHHDVQALPNGNILTIVWEAKTNTEAIAQGRNPALTTTTVWSEKIVEIQPVGTNGANIVWEWHLWDHLIQDFDSTKANFGSIAANPQLLNINFNASANPNPNGKDWIHLNSIDYNPTLDQILVSSHNFSEIWIIDHSTTTAEAASHSGGNSGKGGDILYRWGNPQAYNNGSAADQNFFGQHNACWIKTGLPYQNQIMVFNNGNGRIGGNYSTVEIINPPDSGYIYTPIFPYLPVSPSWTYNAGNPNNFYAKNISGAQQLSNGNVLICNGPIGSFFEIDSTGTQVWNYINPVTQNGITPQGSSSQQNLVFRCSFYLAGFNGFIGHNLSAGNTLENMNAVSDACNLNLYIENDQSNIIAQTYPNPVTNLIHVKFKKSGYKNVVVALLDLHGKRVFRKKYAIEAKVLHLHLPYIKPGYYLLKITGKHTFIQRKIIVVK